MGESKMIHGESNREPIGKKDIEKAKERSNPWYEFECYLGNHENNNAFDDYGRPIK